MFSTIKYLAYVFHKFMSPIVTKDIGRLSSKSGRKKKIKEKMQKRGNHIIALEAKRRLLTVD